MIGTTQTKRKGARCGEAKRSESVKQPDKNTNDDEINFEHNSGN